MSLTYVTCVNKIRKDGKNISEYELADINDSSKKCVMSADILKKNIASGFIAVDNLKLTKDGRLISKGKSKSGQSRGRKFPSGEIRIANVEKVTLKDVLGVIRGFSQVNKSHKSYTFDLYKSSNPNDDTYYLLLGYGDGVHRLEEGNLRNSTGYVMLNMSSVFRLGYVANMRSDGTLNLGKGINDGIHPAPVHTEIASNAETSLYFILGSRFKLVRKLYSSVDLNEIVYTSLKKDSGISTRVSYTFDKFIHR